jgi:hypothetical protein
MRKLQAIMGTMAMAMVTATPTVIEPAGPLLLPPRNTARFRRHQQIFPVLTRSNSIENYLSRREIGQDLRRPKFQTIRSLIAGATLSVVSGSPSY